MNILHLILIQLVTFVFIVLFLRWLLQANITKAIKRLQNLNRQNMQKEKILKEEIERAKEEGNLEIEKSRDKANHIREEAKEEADRIKEEILVKSKGEAKRIIDGAMKNAKKKEAESFLKMQDQAISVAADIVKYIFTDKNLKNLHVQLLDELIQDIKGLDQRHFDIKQNKVELIYAYTLESRQKQGLKEALSSRFGHDVSLEERQDPEIIAGLIIKMGGFVIDGSIKNKLRKIIPIMKSKYIVRGD